MRKHNHFQIRSIKRNNCYSKLWKSMGFFFSPKLILNTKYISAHSHISEPSIELCLLDIRLYLSNMKVSLIVNRLLCNCLTDTVLCLSFHFGLFPHRKFMKHFPDLLRSNKYTAFVFNTYTYLLYLILLVLNTYKVHIF